MRDVHAAFVLIVEDESLLRLLAMDMVEDAGFEAVEAADADEAIAILEGRQDIRIVFTDIDMPGSMNGLKLAACIRDRWPPVQIIVTSAYFASTALALPKGALFFAKPYKPEVVGRAMQQMVS